MANVVKTFAFATTGDGWTATTNGATVAFTSGDGNPAGSWSFGVSGRNTKDDAGSYLSWTGTFEDLGVPAGSTVSGYSAASFDHRCSAYNVVDIAKFGNGTAALVINDGTARTLVGEQSFTGTTSWANKSNSPAITGLSLPSNTTVTLYLYYVLDNGNNASAAATILADNISLTVEYSAAVSNYTYSGSGTLTFSGAATTSHLSLNVNSYTGAGTLALSGAATTALEKHYSYLPSGGVTFSGAAATEKQGGSVSYTYSGSGTLTLSGAATTAVEKHWAYSGSGAITFSGAAPVALEKHYSYTPSGGLTFSGAAPIEWAGITSKSYTGSGTLAFSGSAAVSKDKVYTPSGGIAFSGAAPIVWEGLNAYSYTGAGTLTFTGAATTSYTRGATSYTYLPTGGLVFSGAAATSNAKAQTITPAQLARLTDIWQRLGLDPDNPLLETDAVALVGDITLTKVGSTSITTTRTGAAAQGNLDAIILDLWRRLGLDPDNPMTVTANRIDAGPLHVLCAEQSGGNLLTRVPDPYVATGYVDPDYVEYTP